MPDFICNDNFDQFAAAHYNHVVFSEDEFYEDLGRIKYIKRLLNKFHTAGELKERLILNHLMILYNIFDGPALTKMLFFRFEADDFHQYLKPLLAFMNRLPDSIEVYTKERPILYTSDIGSDAIIEHELRKLIRYDN